MKYLTIILILLASLLLLTNTFVLAATTVEVRVANGDDDAEEEGGGGDVHFSSSDLELINENDNGNQTVGIRFQNVIVPKDATILNAYIEFTVDENNADDNLDGTLSISGEANDDAPAFIDDVDGAISALDTTSASVSWVLTDENYWTNTGGEKQTPELRSIVQEIVYRAGWNSGQNMAFIITGTGKRVAASYNGSPTQAPLLHIYYEEGVPAPYISASPAESLGASSFEGVNAIPGSFELTNTGTTTLNYEITDDADWLSCSTNCTGTLDAGQSATVGVTFSNYTMSAGTYTGHISIIDANASNSPFEYDVVLLIQEIATGSTCGEVPIYAQDLVDPAILVLLDVSSSMTSMMPVASEDDNPVTPNLQSVVQEIVERADWASGNSMAFIITGSGRRVAESYDGVSSAAPLLSVEYTDGGTPGSFEARVTQTNDDAEESAGGAIDLSSSDLELIREGSDQTVGMRFQDVTIPPGAVITNASIEFTIDETDPTEETNLTIAGEDTGDALVFDSSANNISGRTTTSASVPWDITEQWQAAPEKARYVIGREVISELVEDRDISWGYGHWAFTDHPSPGGDPEIGLLPQNPYSNRSDPTGLYTRIEAGVAHRSVEETETLKTLIEETVATSGTPLGPSMLAAWEYFRGNKEDEDGGNYDANITCQPKFLIDITDGRGYPDHTEDSFIAPYTNLLGDADISVIAVGFGLDDPRQVGIMAQVANERGNSDDDLYALHEVDENDVGQPYMAQNQEELVTALQGIANSIKQQVFVGSSPAPSTSVNEGTFVINATFNAANWTGDLSATPYDPLTGALMMCVDSSGNKTSVPANIYGKCPDTGTTTCNPDDIVVGECLSWTASEMMPATKNAWTVDGDVSESGTLLAANVAGLYVDDHTNLSNYEIGLDGDNYICRDLGDIIKSTPVIVESPNKYFTFDNYRSFKFGAARTRDDMLYVGSNDGALHAIKLITGVEEWRFYPEAVHQKLIDTDICAGDYCHEYFVDGTPVVADIYKGTSDDEWATILISGLGAGGDAYFALDITSANPFVENGSDPLSATTYLWQFTDDELGLTMGVPAIARVSPSEATFGGWAAYFGSGYDVAGSSNKEAYMFGIEAYTMVDLWQDSAGDSINRIKMENNSDYLNDALSDPVVADLDFDGFGDHLYVGNLYGKMYRLTDIGKDQVPAVGVLFDIHPTDINHNTPIRAGASFGYDSGPETIWVYFGTGKFEEQADKFNTEQQYFIGVKDYLDSPVVDSTLSDLLERSTVAVVDDPFNGEDREYRVMTGHTFVYDDGTGLTAGRTMRGVQSGAIGVIESTGTINSKTTVTFTEADMSGAFKMGETIIDDNDNSIQVTLQNHPWYATLQHTTGVPSERVIAKSLVVGGVVFFTSFIPDEDVCGGNGTAWLYALDYETGLPPGEPVFDLDGGGAYDYSDVVTYDGRSYAVAAIPIGRGIPSAPVLEGDMIFVNTTDAAGPGIPVNLPQLKASISAWKDGEF